MGKLIIYKNFYYYLLKDNRQISYNIIILRITSRQNLVLLIRFTNYFIAKRKIDLTDWFREN